jgi:hypothetical protein
VKTVNEYLQHAEECERLAKKTLSTEQRKMIDDMANTWRMLAEQRRANLKKKGLTN